MFVFVLLVVLLIPGVARAGVCQSGYYLDDNGVCTLCQAGYYCVNDVRTQCTGLSYSENDGATECTPCPMATKYADLVNSYWYYDYYETGLHKHGWQCRARFKTCVATHGTISSFSCAMVDGDYGTLTAPIEGNTTCLVKALTCDAGYWAINGAGNYWDYSYTAVLDTVCQPVGVGYWSPADSLERFECTNAPENAVYTGGAESNDCPWQCADGYLLRSNGECAQLCTGGFTTIRTSTGIIVPLFANKNTTPSINLQRNGITCYGDLVEGTTTGEIHIKYNGITYHSVSH